MNEQAGTLTASDGAEVSEINSGGGAAPTASAAWSSRFAFIAAAVGSAIGLGNIWKFPYMAGANGGGAFVIMYLGMVALIGVPILIAEFAIGRNGGAGVTKAFSHIINRRDGSGWNLFGWLGGITGVMVLSFYSIVAGWALSYGVKFLSGAFQGLATEAYSEKFGALLASPVEMIAWQAAILVITACIGASGVRAGLDRAVRWLMPLLALLLVGLSIYAAIVGDVGAAVDFLFTPDFSALTPDVALSAAGHAFFTLSLGFGAMIAYGGYLPEGISIPKAVGWVAFFDTLCALVSGMVIFPLVFGFGMDPASGPGLIFETLPVVFGSMPAGAFAGSAFFMLLVIAAITSTFALVEPLAASLSKDAKSRSAWVVGLTAISGLLGLVSVFSFNIWSDVKILGGEKSLFDWLSFVTTEVSLPIGGLGVALFAGWVVPKTVMAREFGSAFSYRLWHGLIRYVTPIAVLAIFVHLVL